MTQNLIDKKFYAVKALCKNFLEKHKKGIVRILTFFLF